MRARDYWHLCYGKLREGARRMIAEGDRGQLLSISPAHNVIVVRNGFDFGIPRQEWTHALAEAKDDR